jgi:heme-degrading monooxygenase HmoA
MFVKTLIAVSMLAFAAPALAQQVAVLVVVPTPPGLSRERIEAGMKASIPQYEKLPGLVRKYFTMQPEGFGGMYLWKDRAAAEAWFNAAWHERVKKTYGRDGSVTYFDVPAATEGPSR